MKRILGLLVAVGLGAGVYFGGVVDALRDPEWFRSFVASSGAVGPTIYVTTFWILEPLGVPILLFIIPASLIWPQLEAFLLSWLGLMGSGIVAFSFARWVARDWVQARLPERFRRYDARLSENGLKTVMVVRLFFFVSWGHLALGVSNVRLHTFVLGSALAIVPGTALVVFLGGNAFAWLGSVPDSVWISAGLALSAWLLWRRLLWLRDQARSSWA